MPEMGWVRIHKRYGAWPGLAALALQLVLSFGHVHIGNVHIGGAVEALGIAAAKSLYNSHRQSAGVTLAQAPQKSPAQNSHRNSGDDDDYCAICASIFLASTASAAQPPQLPVPLGFERVAQVFASERGISASRPTYFQSRAPPVA
jgi:hypothetical protein